MLHNGLLLDVEQFRRAVPGLLTEYKVPVDKLAELWALRAFALRVGREPAGLFHNLLLKKERWNRAGPADLKAGELARVEKAREPEDQKDKPLDLPTPRPLTAKEMDAKMRRMKDYSPVPKNQQGMTLAQHLELERGTKALVDRKKN